MTDAGLAGTGVRGLAERVGWVISGVIHLGLGIAAIKFAANVPQRTATLW